jgi:hypothetical protein
VRVTYKFGFTPEFRGEFSCSQEEFDKSMSQVKSKPQDYLECSQDLTEVVITWSTSGSSYKVNMDFVIKVTDDEEYWDNGGTSDNIDVWEGDFPAGELKLKINGVLVSPKFAEFQEYR